MFISLFLETLAIIILCVVGGQIVYTALTKKRN